MIENEINTTQNNLLNDDVNLSLENNELESPPQKKKFRYHFLIEKRFQLKYSIILASIGGFITLVLATIILFLTIENYNIFINSGIVSEAEMIKGLKSQQELITKLLFVIFIVITIILFLIGIVFTHKISGPLYALKRFLNSMTEGKLDTAFKLRKNDEFKDIATTFNKAIESLKKFTKEELIILCRVKNSIQRDFDTNSTSNNLIIDDLNKLIERKKSQIK